MTKSIASSAGRAWAAAKVQDVVAPPWRGRERRRRREARIDDLCAAGGDGELLEWRDPARLEMEQHGIDRPGQQIERRLAPVDGQRRQGGAAPVAPAITQRSDAEVIVVRVGHQECPHCGKIATETPGGGGDIRPGVDQQVVVDQGRRAAADVPAAPLAGDAATIAAAPQLGNPLRGGRSKERDLHPPPRVFVRSRAPREWGRAEAIVPQPCARIAVRACSRARSSACWRTVTVTSPRVRSRTPRTMSVVRRRPLVTASGKSTVTSRP